jgi:hypothetical protein
MKGINITLIIPLRIALFKRNWGKLTGEILLILYKKVMFWQSHLPDGLVHLNDKYDFKLIYRVLRKQSDSCLINFIKLF